MARLIIEGNTVRAIDFGAEQKQTVVIHKHGRAQRIELTRDVRSGQMRMQVHEAHKEAAPVLKPIPKRVFAWFFKTALIGSLTLIMASGYYCVHMNTQIASRADAIASKQKQLEQMKLENDALEQSIDHTIDQKELYRIATQELGMVPADQSQVIQYQKKDPGYVRQYDAIPEK